MNFHIYEDFPNKRRKLNCTTCVVQQRGKLFIPSLGHFRYLKLTAQLQR